MMILAAGPLELTRPLHLLRLVCFALAFSLGAGLAGTARAGELAVGDAVPALAAKDQFDQPFKFTPGLHYLLLGFDMGASKQANLKLADLGAGWLEQRGAVFMLDIHTMPGIARFFALPKMRKYPQRIILADDAKMLEPFPRQPERITVLVLKPDGKIQSVRYWNPSADPLAPILQ
jgi:hypothetical protein